MQNKMKDYFHLESKKKNKLNNIQMKKVKLKQMLQKQN